MFNLRNRKKNIERKEERKEERYKGRKYKIKFKKVKIIFKKKVILFLSVLQNRFYFGFKFIIFHFFSCFKQKDKDNYFNSADN